MANTAKSLNRSQSTTVALKHHVIRKLTGHQNTVGTVTGRHHAIRNIATLHQSTLSGIKSKSVHKIIRTTEFSQVKHSASHNVPKFVISEHTHVQRQTALNAKHHLNQSTQISRHENQHHNLRLNEQTHPMHKSTPDKSFKAYQENHIKTPIRHVTSTHKISLTTHVRETKNLHVKRVISATTGIKHVSTPGKLLHDQIHQSVRLNTPTLHIHRSIKNDTQIHAHSDTIRLPFDVNQNTHVTRTSRVEKNLTIRQTTTVTQPHKAIRYTITVVETPLVAFSANVARNNVPIMGSIWQATDIVGQQVQTVADLHDYYFFFNQDDIPSLSWGFSDLQRNTTNDSYKFWKTK